MVAQRNGIVISIEPHVGDSLICRARQEMTWKFLQTDCTHFMQLDDDIQLMSDAILKLVKADKPIVGGAYGLKDLTKVNGEANVVSGGGHKAALRSFGSLNLEDYSDQLVKIQYLSTGCFLQKREVIETMWDKYTDLEYYSTGYTYPDTQAKSTVVGKDERRALYMPMIYEGEYLSEDWAYCKRASDIGYDIWLHTGVLCGHWGIYQYKLDKEVSERDKSYNNRS